MNPHALLRSERPLSAEALFDRVGFETLQKFGLAVHLLRGLEQLFVRLHTRGVLGESPR